MTQSIQVNSLNFDNIKSSLKTHLSNTAVFKDYDFDGSGLSVILDLLAYTTYYQGFTITLLPMRCSFRRQKVEVQ